MIKPCPVCGSMAHTFIFEHDKIPKYNLRYFATREQALSAEVVKVSFLQCDKCGFLFNEAFQQLDYQVQYDSSRTGSVFVRNYYKSVADFIKDKLRLNSGFVVEVGCGDGEFAQILSSILGPVDLIGFEPKSDPKFVSQTNSLRFVNDYYNESALEGLGVPDAVICRHTMEHIEDVVGFFSTLSLGNPRYIVIEVPCSGFVLNNNFHYFSNEHCSYFDLRSLSLLGAKFDYFALDFKYIFNEENIIIVFEHSIVSPQVQLQVSETKRVEKSDISKNFSDWRANILAKIDAEDVLWGVGGKGAMLLPLLGLDYTVMPVVIDINRDLDSTFVGVSGNEVKTPDFLKRSQNKVKTIFCSNSLYRDEISRTVDSYGVSSLVRNLFND